MNVQGFWDVAALSDAPLIATHSSAHALSPSTRNLTDRRLDSIKGFDGIVSVNFSVGFLRPEGRNEADTPISCIVEHFNYLVNRMGPDHVVFGADLDGARIREKWAMSLDCPELSKHCALPATRNQY